MTDGYDGAFFGEAFDRDRALAWAKAVLADTEAPFAGAGDPQAYIERYAPQVAEYMRIYATDEEGGARGELAEMGIATDDAGSINAVYAAMAWKAYAHWDADMDWVGEHFRDRAQMDSVELQCASAFAERMARGDAAPKEERIGGIEAQKARSAASGSGRVALDPKGRAVLARFGEDALVFQGEGAVQPFVVAYDYDPATGEWAYGSYYSCAANAWAEADPAVVRGGTGTWVWDTDLAEALEEAGHEPTPFNMKLLENELCSTDGLAEAHADNVRRALREAIADIEGYLSQAPEQDGFAPARAAAPELATDIGDAGSRSDLARSEAAKAREPKGGTR